MHSYSTFLAKGTDYHKTTVFVLLLIFRITYKSYLELLFLGAFLNVEAGSRELLPSRVSSLRRLMTPPLAPTFMGVDASYFRGRFG